MPDAGYFMYFSTMTGEPEESALLESRTLYPKRRLQCLQFFYKMTGSPKDRLILWVKMDDGTGTVRRMKKIHTVHGTQWTCSAPMVHSTYVELYNDILSNSKPLGFLLRLYIFQHFDTCSDGLKTYKLSSTP